MHCDEFMLFKNIFKVTIHHNMKIEPSAIQHRLQFHGAKFEKSNDQSEKSNEFKLFKQHFLSFSQAYHTLSLH